MIWNEDRQRWTCLNEEELAKLAAEWLSWLSFYYSQKNEQLDTASFKDLVINQVIEGEIEHDVDNWFDVVSLSKEERQYLYKVLSIAVDNIIIEQGGKRLLSDALDFKQEDLDDLIHETVTYFESEYKAP